jgi:hypothetical protein
MNVLGTILSTTVLVYLQLYKSSAIMCSSVKVGAIEGVVDHIFSYIHNEYSSIIVKHTTFKNQLFHIDLVFRSNLHKYYRSVLLSKSFYSKVCNAAALDGHLECLKWARQNSCPWSAITCANAAQGGHLEVLQWARASGCKWDKRTCSNAASFGHLKVLQWARTNGCDWDSWTCSNAATRGHLEVLQWARANGCKWDAGTCTYAALYGHVEVVQWARGNGCDCASILMLQKVVT